MTFEGREYSLAEGQPIALYEFAHGVTTWRYSSADRSIITGAQTWLSIPGGVRDEGIRQSGDPASDALTILAPADLPVVRLFRGLPPTTEVAVVVRFMHAGDAELSPAWVGSITQVNRRGVDRVEIVCDSLVASMQRGGLAIGYERSCPYALYDHNCKVNRDLFRVDATLSGALGTTIEAAAFGTVPDGWFAGGYVEWQSAPGVTERRFIKAHAGTVLTLLGGAQGMAPGTPVSAYAGCDRTAQTCLDKFNNLDNHGGFPSLPGKSPFDGELQW